MIRVLQSRGLTSLESQTYSKTMKVLDRKLQSLILDVGFKTDLHYHFTEIGNLGIVLRVNSF